MVTGFLLLDTLLVGRPDMFWDAIKHMMLPAFALGIAFSPTIMRVLRSSLLDVYQEDYIHQARLRGLSERRILLRHALKNAILPTLSLMGVQFGFLFGGTLLVEVIYSYPGLGNLMVDAVRNADLPIIQTVGLTYCVVVLVINTVVDALYVVLNPEAEGRVMRAARMAALRRASSSGSTHHRAGRADRAACAVARAARSERAGPASHSAAAGLAAPAARPTFPLGTDCARALRAVAAALRRAHRR